MNDQVKKAKEVPVIGAVEEVTDADAAELYALGVLHRERGGVHLKHQSGYGTELGQIPCTG